MHRVGAAGQAPISTTRPKRIPSLGGAQGEGRERSFPLREADRDVEDEGSEVDGRRLETTGATGAEHAEALPEIRPWCEVGWIFRGGDAQAIERQGDRVRAARVVHPPDD